MSESSPTRMESLGRDGWKWMVRGYYGPGGRAGTHRNPNRGRVGEREGDLALETVHKNDVSKDMEVAVFEQRPDIGSVVVVALRDDATPSRPVADNRQETP